MKKLLTILLSMFMTILLSMFMTLALLPIDIMALENNIVDTINAHRDVIDEDIYFLTRCDSSNLKNGDEIAWLDQSYTENEFTSVGVPNNSGIVKIVQKSDAWEAFYPEQVNHYLDVIKSGNGFDLCMHGTLNHDVTEYNCYLGGVQHLIGTSYTFISKPFYSKVIFKLNIDGAPATGHKVQLFDGKLNSNGSKTLYTLTDNGNGDYSSDTIFVGDYSIYVDDKPVNLGISVGKTINDGYYYIDTNGKRITTTNISEATAYYSGNVYEVVGNLFNYKISVKCDDNYYDNLGKVSLVANNRVYSLVKTGVGTYQGTLSLPTNITSNDISIYVGDIKTDAIFQTTMDLSETYKNNDIIISFYTAKVTALLDNNNPMSGYTVSFDNGSSQYYAKTNASGVAQLPVLIMSDGTAERPYTVKIDSVVDNTGEPITLSSADKYITLNYHTLSFYTGEKGKEKLFRVQAVREGSKPNKVANAPLDGYVFDFWSETKWEKVEDPNTIAKYDFTQPITAVKNVYAHATKPAINIYDTYIGTDISGTIKTTDPEAFRMPAVTITGFPKGNVLKCFNLELTNIDKVYFYNTSDLTIKQAGGVSPDSVTNGLSTTSRKVTVSFSNKTSMTWMENYIRENVVFVPASNQEVTIKLTVSDDVISVEDTSTIEQSQCTDTSWSKLTDSAEGITLNGGKYYIDSNATITGKERKQKNDPAQPGITIQGTVSLYIPSGKTLTVTGSNGIGIMGGQAGILLLEGNVLYVYGGGTLIATGGKAGDGTDGENASRTIGTNSIKANTGHGGYGGGGAGAGIGTNGAYASNNNPSAPSGIAFNFGNSGGDYRGGSKGNDGISISDRIGTLYIANTIDLIATGGAAGSGGQGGTMEDFYRTTHNSKTIVSGIIGGGGGGYGGQAGASVGQGGGSGGQGGSGAIGYLGSYANYTDYSRTS